MSKLPYFQEASYTPHWFSDPDEIPSGFHQIGEFSLTNQAGKTVTEKEMTGKLTVVDFFFTSCPGICPKMTRNMTLVQEAFQSDNEVMILSYSVTPEQDSVQVLQRYAKGNGVIDGKWHLLTGPRKKIYDLGRNAYFIEEDLGLFKKADDFIHTETLYSLMRTGISEEFTMG